MALTELQPFNLNNTANYTFGNATVTGNINVGNATIYTTSNTLVITNPDGGSFIVSGNGNSSTSELSSGNSNISISSNGNINFTVAGISNVAVFTSTGAVLSNVTTNNVTANTLAGSLTNASQPNVTSLGTLTSLDVTGNITAGNVYANSGTVKANVVNATTISGTLTTANQPNVTSLGTLTGLNVAGTSNLGSNSNVIITGGTSGQYLQTDGNGNLNWTTIVTSGVSNGNSSISIPIANGNVNTSVNGVSNVFVITSTGANVAGTLNATGNANVGNLGATDVIATTIAGSLTTANQPNVTSLGTLTNLSVTGSVTSGNVYANSGTINANILSANTIDGTLTTANQPNVTSLGTLSSLSVSGNISAGNLLGGNLVNANFISGTVITSSQPNITSLGSLSSLTVTGNTNSGNVNAGNLLTANFITGTLTTAAQPNITSLGTITNANVSGNIQVNGNVITDNVISRTGLLTLSASGTDQDVDIKPTGNGIVDVWGARIGNIGTPTQATDAATKDYVDSVAQGLNVHPSCYVATAGTLNAASGGTVSYNNGSSGVGATLITTGTYLLIDGANVQTAGTRILVKNEANAAWNGIYVYTNTTTLTRASDFDTSAEAAGGDFVFITSGNTNADTGWVQTTDNPTLGTSPIVWTQFAGQGSYTAGTGLTLTGTQFSITDTTVTAASYGNGDRTVSFTVNQQGQLTAASNVVIAANAANLTGTTLSSNIINSSLTNVGTLSNLTVTGNIGGGNLNTSGKVVASSFESNVSTGTAPMVVASSTKVANLNADLVDGYDASTSATANTLVVRDTDGSITANLVTGTLATASQPNITSVGTLTSLGVNGTITAVNITANTGVFTGNGNGLSSLQASNIIGAIASATSATNASALLQNTSTSTTVYPTFTTSSANGNSSAVFNTGISANLGNASITATTFVGALSGAATTAGTVTTAAQPNITSLGTLTSLGVNGTVTAVAFTANTGIFTGNGSGLSAIAGANVTGTVSSATTAGTVTTAAQPNITSVGTLSSLAVTGNGTFGNILGPLANGNSNVNIPSANGNVNISAAGNANVAVITGTGVNVAGTINATGNITANFYLGNGSQLTGISTSANTPMAYSWFIS